MTFIFNLFTIFCFSCEADDRLEVASGMGQDCSCCGRFGQNRKFQSCLQVRKGCCFDILNQYHLPDPPCKCTEQNKEYHDRRDNINKNGVTAQLGFLVCHWGRWVIAELKMPMDITQHVFWYSSCAVSPTHLLLCFLSAEQRLFWELKLSYSFYKEWELITERHSMV